jgi:hypothetical protein
MTPHTSTRAGQPGHAWGAAGKGEWQVGEQHRAWMEAGPQSMKLARLRSRMRCRLLCTCVGSTSPCPAAAAAGNLSRLPTPNHACATGRQGWRALSAETGFSGMHAVEPCRSASGHEDKEDERVLMRGNSCRPRLALRQIRLSAARQDQQAQQHARVPG